MSEQADSFQPIPLTILTGFLGAGKTTLLNHILNSEHGLKIAVLVNDFGEVNVDSRLIVDVEGETVSLSNGCICCTIRDDLLRTVIRLLARPDRPDYILIETSGVSDPVSVALTFMMPDIRPLINLDSILTVIDADQVLSLKGENALLAMDQIGAADMVVLNKVDLITSRRLEKVRRWVRDIAPDARIFETSFGKIPLELALGVGRFDLIQLNREARDVHVHAAEGEEQEEHGEEEHHHHHDHDHSLVYNTWVYRSFEPFTLKNLREVTKNLPPSIYRAKGFVYLSDAPARRGILHLTGRRVRLSLGEYWRKDEVPNNETVVIGSAGGVDAQDLKRRFEWALTREVNRRKTPLSEVVDWVRSSFNQA